MAESVDESLSMKTTFKKKENGISWPIIQFKLSLTVSSNINGSIAGIADFSDAIV